MTNPWIREQTCDVGSISINYAEGPPSGTPLILLHGITRRWQAFLPVLPALMVRWHVYALDFRGHGQSGHVPGEYRAADYARDTVEFIRHRVGEPTILLGHSLGGMVAVQVAAEFPGVVKALVLEDPPLYMAPQLQVRRGPFYEMFVALHALMSSGCSMNELLPALVELQPALDGAAHRESAKSLSQADPDVLATQLDGRLFDGYDTDSFLRRIACPVLLLQGDPALGACLSDDEAKHAVSVLSDGTLVRMAGVGHGIHKPQPAAFCRVVSDFLESL